MNENSPKQSTKLAIALFMLPILLVISSSVILLIINLIFNPTFWMTPDSEAVASTPVLITATNAMLIIVGAIGLVSLLPGLVVGVYLLVKRKRSMTKTAISE